MPTAPDDDLSAGLIGAVLCPLTDGEVPRALANLALWNDDFPPSVESLAPTDRPRLVFAFNGAENDMVADQLRASYAGMTNLHRSFAAIDIIFLDLPPEKDVYQKSSVDVVSPYGNKAGPNWMFQEAMRRLRGHARFVLLMETDCQPLVADWLRRLIATCARNDDAWIIGAPYTGASAIKRSIARHINGNALYQIGDDGFWIFLTEILWPWMHAQVVDDPNIAYDCAWELYLDRPDMETGDHGDWLTARDVLHRFRLTDTIVNVGGHAEQSGKYIWTRRQLLERTPRAVIVHGPVCDDDGDHRRGAASVGRATVSGGGTIVDAQLTLSDQLALFSRSMWLDSDLFEPGDVIGVTLTVDGPERQPVMLDLRSPKGKMLDRHRLLAGAGNGREIEADFVLADRYRYVTLALHPIVKLPLAGPMRIVDLTVRIKRNDTVLATLRDFIPIDFPVAS